MTPRERLEIVAQFVETLAPPMGPSDAAALRELDQLCEELTQWAKAYIEPHDPQYLENHPVKKLVDRAAQAGYGEK